MAGHAAPMSLRPPAQLGIPYDFASAFGTDSKVTIPQKIGALNLTGVEFWSSGNVEYSPPPGALAGASPIQMPATIPVRQGFYEWEVGEVTNSSTVTGMTAWYGPLSPWGA